MRSKPNEGSKFNRITGSQIDFRDRCGSVDYLYFLTKPKVAQRLGALGMGYLQRTLE
jgi:hypothetical protein